MAPRAEVDVCIVGSGAGGGVLARELSLQGLDVLVLEVGGRLDRSRIPTPQADWELHPKQFFEQNPARDRVSYTKESNPTFQLSRLKTVGGTTMHYEGFCSRPHPGELRRRSEVGVAADWPIAYDALTPHFDRVEAMLGLSGELDNPFEPPRGPYPNPAIAMSCGVLRVKRGCDALGLHAAHAPLAILSRPAQGRAQCNFCGGCWSGCFMGAISNMSQTYIPAAEKSGARIQTNAMATRVLVSQDGKRAEAVEYIDENGKPQLQKAKVVALCANAVETPRLLLLSARSDHPDGLANSSGLVGTHFSCHTIVSARGLFDERIDAYKGPNINGMVQDYYDHDDKRDFAGGYVLALRNAEGGPVRFCDTNAAPRQLFGEELVSFMDTEFGHSAAISAYGEHFASAQDRVDLDPEVKDSFGLPVPRIQINLHDNDQTMLRHMKRTVTQVMQAAGARDVSEAVAPGFLGTHLLGTCRMGVDPGSSVTDPFGETHDVANLFIADGSLFPTSTAGNPTLTIQALATRVAGRIAEKSKQA
jgi:choline dehydrogenase-like flavoprotein